MSVRPRMLPEGWYPAVRREVVAKLGAWDRVDAASHAEQALACIGPHAGWYYSGRIAWAAWRSAADSDAVVVIGGHLPAGSDFRYSPEDGLETPLGTMVADKDLRDAVSQAVSAVADKGADNTVEVHLPMAANRFPGIPVACFRAPNDARAAQLGSAIAEYAASSGRMGSRGQDVQTRQLSRPSSRWMKTPRSSAQNPTDQHALLVRQLPLLPMRDI